MLGSLLWTAGHYVWRFERIYATELDGCTTSYLDVLPELFGLTDSSRRCHSSRSSSPTPTSRDSRSSTAAGERERLTVRLHIVRSISLSLKFILLDYARKRLITQAKNK